MLTLLPAAQLGRLLDIGTGTGRLLELLAPRVRAGWAWTPAAPCSPWPAPGWPSRSWRIARAAGRHVSPAAGDGAFDVAVLQMVLHYAEDPAAALAEAARVLAPGGRLVVVDLAGTTART